MPATPSFRKYIMVMCSLPLGGCVYTGSEFTPQFAGDSIRATTAKLPGDVLLTEGTELNQSFLTIGEVSAHARKFTVFARTPTREDVNQALREKAAEMGADAVIGIQYDSERTYFPFSAAGEMRATGKAVFIIGNRP